MLPTRSHMDPRFALARARLAEILEDLYGAFDHRPAVLAEARSHAEEALRLSTRIADRHTWRWRRSWRGPLSRYRERQSDKRGGG